MEYFGFTIDDKSHVIGGTQSVTTPDGNVIPLVIQNGLAWMSLHCFTDEEYNTCPHVFFTHEKTWHPTVLDHSPTDDPQLGVVNPPLTYSHWVDVEQHTFATCSNWVDGAVFLLSKRNCPLQTVLYLLFCLSLYFLVQTQEYTALCLRAAR
jgi:hypothetical protein